MPVPLADQRLQVGAPDPELETSPIVGEEDELEVLPDAGAAMCYFNSTAYRVGDSVLSGSELLRCEAPGVWVRQGEYAPRHGAGPA